MQLHPRRSMRPLMSCHADRLVSEAYRVRQLKLSTSRDDQLDDKVINYQAGRHGLKAKVCI